MKLKLVGSDGLLLQLSVDGKVRFSKEDGFAPALFRPVRGVRTRTWHRNLESVRDDAHSGAGLIWSLSGMVHILVLG